MRVGILADRSRDLPSFVTNHEGVKILDRFLEQVTCVKTVGPENLELENVHRPEKEKGEGHDVNGHHHQQGSPAGARNPSGQALQTIKKPVAEIHPVHSSE